MNKTPLWNGVGYAGRAINRLAFPLQKDTDFVIRFDTSIGTDNLGDNIIMYYCNKILDELFPTHSFLSIGTHLMPTQEQEEKVKQTKYKFVCGTNLLTSHIEHYWNWILPDGIRKKMNYRNVILLGVGWGEYQDACSDYSRMVYRCILNPCLLHSVRDQYTLEKLQQAGFTNVVNTGCPTTWGLTETHCRSVPVGKADAVVTTVTDYRPDPEGDQAMLDILSRNYEKICLWPQGGGDLAYLTDLKLPHNQQILPRSLAAYEALLTGGNVDYVGTRLHGGIHALNYGVRTIILSVDNRAAEMGRDLGLPILDRSRIAGELEKRIREDFETKIRIPQDNIDRFRNQFRR